MGALCGSLAGAYDLTVMDWLWARIDADGRVIDSGTDVDALLKPNPPTAWTLTDSLAAVSVTLGHELSSSLSLPFGLSLRGEDRAEGGPNGGHRSDRDLPYC